MDILIVARAIRARAIRATRAIRARTTTGKEKRDGGSTKKRNRGEEAKGKRRIDEARERMDDKGGEEKEKGRRNGISDSITPRIKSSYYDHVSILTLKQIFTPTQNQFSPTSFHESSPTQSKISPISSTSLERLFTIHFL